MRNFKVEYTDTLGGDANYSWCERETVSLSDCATDRQIVLACKNAVGLSGVKCDRQEWGEGIMLHPRGECTVVFIYPQYWITFTNIIFRIIMTHKQALIQALQLAITAPTDELAQECAAIADSIASRLTTEEIEACKLIAAESTLWETKCHHHLR